MPTRYRAQRILVADQPSAGTAATLTSADALECEPVTIPLNRAVLQPSVGWIGPGEPAPESGRWDPITFTLKMRLHGVSPSTPTNNPAITPELRLLRNAIGSIALDGYSTDVLDTGDASTVDVTTGVGAHVGHAVLIPSSGAPSARVIRWIRSLSTNTYTTFDSLGVEADRESDTAGTGYGSAVCYGSMAEQNPLTIGLRTDENENSFVLVDCYVSGQVKISRSATGEMMLEVPIRCVGGVVLDESLAEAASPYTYPRIPQAVGSNGSSVYVDGSETCYGEWTATIDVQTSDVECTSGLHGIGPVNTLSRVYKLEMARVRIGSWANIASEQPGTDPGSIQIDACTTPGRAMGILMPEPRRAAQDQMADRGGLWGVTEVYTATIYTGDTESGAGAPADSMFRVGFC